MIPNQKNINLVTNLLLINNSCLGEFSPDSSGFLYKVCVTSQLHQINLIILECVMIVYLNCYAQY